MVCWLSIPLRIRRHLSYFVSPVEKSVISVWWKIPFTAIDFFFAMVTILIFFFFFDFLFLFLFRCCLRCFEHPSLISINTPSRNLHDFPLLKKRDLSKCVRWYFYKVGGPENSDNWEGGDEEEEGRRGDEEEEEGKGRRGGGGGRQGTELIRS